LSQTITNQYWNKNKNKNKNSTDTTSKIEQVMNITTDNNSRQQFEIRPICDSCYNEKKSYHTSTTYTVDVEHKRDPISHYFCNNGHLWEKPMPQTDLSTLHKILKVHLCWIGEKDGTLHPCCYELCDKPHQSILEYNITGQPLGEMNMGYVTRQKLEFLIREERLYNIRFYDRITKKWCPLTQFTGVKKD
jgi:hypothetical protein